MYILLIHADTFCMYALPAASQQLTEGAVFSQEDPLTYTVETTKHYQQFKLEIREIRDGRR